MREKDEEPALVAASRSRLSGSVAMAVTGRSPPEARFCCRSLTATGPCHRQSFASASTSTGSRARRRAAWGARAPFRRRAIAVW